MQTWVRRQFEKKEETKKHAKFFNSKI